MQGARETRGDQVDVERLQQVVVRAFLHSLHRDLEVRDSRGHDESDIRMGRAQVTEQVHAGKFIHAEIGNYRVNGFTIQNFQCFLYAAGAVALDALLSEHDGEHFAEREFVINGQDLGGS